MIDASAGHDAAREPARPLPVWRSLLYVPANVERFIDGAHRRGADAIILDLEDSVDHVRLVTEVVGELEAERGMAVGATQFIVMIETAAAFFRMGEIARADRRIVAMTLGAEDFCLSVGMVPDADGLLFPKQQLAIAAR